MTLIKLNNISKSFMGKMLYRDVTTRVNQGEVIGVLGENGSGKTTLLNMISGVESVSSGEISINKEVSISTLNQNPYINPSMVVQDLLNIPFLKNINLEKQMEKISCKISQSSSSEMENLLDQYSKVWEEFEKVGGYSYHEIQDEFIQVFNLKSHLKKEYSTLSGGEKQYVNLALTLFGHEEVVLLDEPTTYLDIHKTNWLLNYIKESTKTFLIVSHDTKFISLLSTVIFDIDNEKIIPYYCNYKNYLLEKSKYLEKVKQLNRTSNNEIENKVETIKKKRLWIKTAEHKKPHAIVIKRLERDINKLKREQNILLPEQKYLFPKMISETKTTEKIIEIINVTKRFGETYLFENISLSLYSHSKICILGENGCGKTTLLNMIIGKEPVTKGVILVNPKPKISVVPQELPNDFKNNTVLNYVMKSSFVGVLLAEETINTIFDGHIDKNTRVSSLSGGEQKRLQISVAILNGADFLLLDEPTTFMDEYSINLLVKMLQKFNGGLIIISHNKSFLSQLNMKKYLIKERKLVSMI